MDNFPERVTLFEDEVYRWHYDMDMWHNRYMIRLAIKVISLIMLLPVLLSVVSLLSRLPTVIGSEFPREKIMWFIGGDLQFLLIVVGLWLGMIVLAELIYAVCALAMKGTYRLYFHMDESAVALVRKPGTMETLNTLGAAVGIIGLLAGKPGEALRVGGTLAVANNVGTSRFESTRRVKCIEKYDLLDLREFLGMNQIYVPKADYEAVRAFILEHISDKARIRSKKKRLKEDKPMKKLFACILVLMLVTLPALADFGFREEGLPDGSTVLHFEDMDLTLPAGWEDKALMIDGEGGLNFYQAASYEKYLEEDIPGGGYLFTLGASVNASFSELPAFKYLGFSEDSAMNYYLILPTDYPAWMGDDAIRAEYDEMLAQVDAIAASAVFPDNQIVEDGNGLGDEVDVVDGNGLAEEPEDGTGQYEAGGTGTMTTDAEESEADATQGGVTLEQIRYHFEHSALPRFFYEDPANMLDVLGDVGAFPVFAALANENGVVYPYTEEDFTQNLYAADDGTVILQITMPQPEETPQCYRVYMVYNSSAGIAGYYTVEYDNMLGETAFLCGWTADMTHMNYGGAAILNPADNDYAAQLETEAEQIAALAGTSGTVVPMEAAPQDTGDSSLARVECPEQGFTTLANPAYATKYEEGTGLYIYTEEAGRIPYVIVYRSQDLLGEPLDYIKEQYTPHMQEQYGDDLVSYVEYEFYNVGGKQLPAGLYTYRLQGRLIDALRVYDSTGDTTVVYTAKYENGSGDTTLQVLDAAIHGYQAR